MSSIHGKNGTSSNSLDVQSTTAVSGRESPSPARASLAGPTLGDDEHYVLASQGQEADFAKARQNHKSPATSPIQALGPAKPSLAARNSNGISLASASFSTAPPPSPPNSAAPSYGHADDELLAAGPASTPKAKQASEASESIDAPQVGPAKNTAAQMSLTVAKGLWSLVKGTYDASKHPLTHKLLLLGGLVACTTTFACLAVVTGGLFGAGLFLLMAPTVALAALIIKQHAVPVIAGLLNKSQGSCSQGAEPVQSSVGRLIIAQPARLPDRALS